MTLQPPERPTLETYKDGPYRRAPTYGSVDDLYNIYPESCPLFC